MGDAKNEDLRAGFDSRLKLKFCGSRRQIPTAAAAAELLGFASLNRRCSLNFLGLFLNCFRAIVDADKVEIVRLGEI